MEALRLKLEQAWAVSNAEVYEINEEDEMILEFGKYKGMDISAVPRDYVEWLLDSRRKDVMTYEAELARRDAAEVADESWAEKLVHAGYRAMMKQVHPDVGGSAAEVEEVKNAKVLLDQVLASLKASAGVGK